MSGSSRIDARDAVRDDVDRVLDGWRKSAPEPKPRRSDPLC
jgi:hypothetical protein